MITQKCQFKVFPYTHSPITHRFPFPKSRVRVPLWNRWTFNRNSYKINVIITLSLSRTPLLQNPGENTGTNIDYVFHIVAFSDDTCQTVIIHIACYLSDCELFIFN